MLRTRFVSQIALLSLLGGLLQSAGPSTARMARSQAYVGTITIASDNFGLGAYTPTMLGYDLGYPPLWDSPLILDQHDHYYPDLATVVPTVANGGTAVVGGDEVVTVHLKPGMRWSDGSPITPADYVGSLLLQSAPVAGDGPALATGADCFGYGSLNGPIKSATATSTLLTVTFTGIFAPALDGCIPAPFPMEYYQRKYHVRLPAAMLTSYQADQAAKLFASPSYRSSPLGRLVAACEHDPYTSPDDVFSGPYKLGSWAPGRRGVMVPNLYYAAQPPDPRHPRPARIVFELLSGNYATLLKDLATPAAYSRIDNAYEISSNDCAAPPALRRTGYRVLVERSSALEHLELNQANAALRDRRVRQALAYAIDKDAYMQAVCPTLTAAERDGLAQTSIIPAASPWSNNRDLPRNLYNPAKAAALLAAAGYAPSRGGPGRHLRFDFYTTGAPFRVRSARELQRQWARLGVSITLHFAPQRGPGGLLAPYSDGGVVFRRTFDIAEFSIARPVEDVYLHPPWLDPSQIPDRNHPDVVNYAGVRDLPLFSLLTRAERTVDEAQRHRLYDQFQNDMVDKAYWIPLLTRQSIIVVKPTLGNFKPNVYGWSTWNAFEWYQGARG